MKIEEIMHREVVSLKPNDSIQEAARLIWKNCASSLTVVENGRLVGEVTRGDLIQVVARESSPPRGGAHRCGARGRDEDAPRARNAGLQAHHLS